MSAPSAIFVFGAPRSGTTLLFQQLCQSTGAAYFTRRLLSKHLRPGRYSVRSVLNALRVKRWKARELKPDGGFEYCARRFAGQEDLAALETEISHGILVIKSINTIQFLEEIDASLPDRFLVHLVRDPRYVVQSLTTKKARQIKNGSFYLPADQRQPGDVPRIACRIWRYYNQEIERHRRDRDLFVRYEDYVQDPMAFLRQVEQATGLPCPEQLLPTRNMNVEPFSDEALILKACGPAMRAYGYV